MMNFTKQSYASSAKVVDGSLVLSLPDATTPVVMRMDLEEVRAAALEVIPKDNQFVLTLKTTPHDIREIAPFETRQQAVNALMAASRALEKGTTVRVPGSVTTTALPADEHSGAKSGALKWIAAVGVLVLLFWMMSNMGGQIPRGPGAGPESASRVNATGATNPNATGAPVSADDFLAGRGQSGQ